MLITFLFLMIMIVFIFTVWLIEHVIKTIDRSHVYGWGNYSKFKREFNKNNWKAFESEPNFLYDCENESRINKCVYEFEKKGMLINNPISFILCEIYIMKHHTKIFPVKNKNIVKW